MARPKKPWHELTTEEAVRRLFHKDMVKHLKKVAHAKEAKVSKDRVITKPR